MGPKTGASPSLSIHNKNRKQERGRAESDHTKFKKYSQNKKGTRKKIFIKDNKTAQMGEEVIKSKTGDDNL